MHAVLTILGLGFLVIFGAIGGIIWLIKSFLAPKPRVDKSWLDGYRQGQMDAQHTDVTYTVR